MSKGKYTNGRGKKGKTTGILVAVVVLLLAVLMVLLLDKPAAEPSVETPAATSGESAEVPEASVSIELQEQSSLNLGYGLELKDSGKYTGIYMEDGSDEVVTGLMMIVVENTGDQDVQYAEITAVSGEQEYNFVLTNLAAGAQVVLLDQQRREAADGALTSAVSANVALFSEPMDLMADTVEITGLKGMLNVKNISGADIAGDIYVYYKYASMDMFYGGITFRVRVEGGLATDEVRQVPAGHFAPKGCTLVQVTVNG